MRVPKILLLAARDIARGEELIMQHDAQDCMRQAANGSGQTSSRIRLYTT
jgi:hypothetical protein